ncbi:hypothetical protein [Peribacillus tepidiphilus]|uniref:hypothetical protein n=1 Tax=Peribacillus tepidiphilus TaxID=2652445 RepID=UPI00129231B0|nr:hypothetical protein [Peribacillus tepidiphilus]
MTDKLTPNRLSFVKVTFEGMIFQSRGIIVQTGGIIAETRGIITEIGGMIKKLVRIGIMFEVLLDLEVCRLLGT